MIASTCTIVVWLIFTPTITTPAITTYLYPDIYAIKAGDILNESEFVVENIYINYDSDDFHYWIEIYYDPLDISSKTIYIAYNTIKDDGISFKKGCLPIIFYYPKVSINRYRSIPINEYK